MLFHRPKSCKIFLRVDHYKFDISLQYCRPVVESPEFSCSEADTLRWRLKLCVPANQSELVTVELELLASRDDAVLRNKFSLLGRNREILAT